MPPDDTLKQIQAAWDEAQAQLVALRKQVVQATEMARAKVSMNLLERDLDRAYRDLGEAVWAEVSKGKLTLSPSLSGVKKALEQVTRRIQEQNATINDLLSEGAEIAKVLQEKMTSPSKTVAAAAKKK
jgi:hypothetical protein